MENLEMISNTTGAKEFSLKVVILLAKAKVFYPLYWIHFSTVQTYLVRTSSTVSKQTLFLLSV